MERPQVRLTGYSLWLINDGGSELSRAMCNSFTRRSRAVNHIHWLVVGPPLWKIWTSLAMMRFPIYGKIKFMFQTTNQYVYICTHLCLEYFRKHASTYLISVWDVFVCVCMNLKIRYHGNTHVAYLCTNRLLCAAYRHSNVYVYIYIYIHTYYTTHKYVNISSIIKK